MSFSLHWPLALLLLPLPWLLQRWHDVRPATNGLRLPPVFERLLTPQGHALGPALRSWRWPGLWAVLAWLCLVLAAARPQWQTVGPAELARLASGRELLLALDLSASMASRDLRLAGGGSPLRRLDAARALAAPFLAGRRGDRVGLIVFGSQPYLYSPPSYDLVALDAALAGIDVGLAGNQTALGDAVALAVRTLAGRPAAERHLVLMTDGANTAGALGPQQAGWLAAREGVRVHALAIGDGDPKALRELAEQTGGAYAVATSSAEMADFFRRLDAIAPATPPAELAAQLQRRERVELTAVVLLAGLFLLAVAVWRQRGAVAEVEVNRDDVAAIADSPWRAVVDRELLIALQTREEPEPRFSGTVPWALLPALLLFAAALLAARGAPEPAGPAPLLRPDQARLLVVELPPGFDADPARRDAFRVELRRFVRALPAAETALAVLAGDGWLVAPASEDPAQLDPFIEQLAADAVPVPGLRRDAAAPLLADFIDRHPAASKAVFWWQLTPGELPAAAGWRQSGVGLHFLQVGGRAEDWLAAAGAGASTGIVPPAWRRSAVQAMPGVSRQWPAVAGWLLLAGLPWAAWWLASASDRPWPFGGRLRRRDRPLATARPLAAGAVGAVLMLMLLLGAAVPRSVVAAGSDAVATIATSSAAADWRQRGAALYRQGRYDAAAAVFASGPPTDPDRHYNLGNALARAGRLRGALAAYDEALRLRPGDDDTRFNRALVERLLSPPPEMSPPPPSSGPQPPPNEQREAERLAAQWLDRPPAAQPGLLQRKLAQEAARRQGNGAKP